MVCARACRKRSGVWQNLRKPVYYFGGQAVDEERAAKWIEAWVRRLTTTGWAPVVVPALEGVRALGPVLGHALIFGAPLLTGLVDPHRLSETADWLSDPRGVGQLLARLEKAPQGEERREG